MYPASRGSGHYSVSFSNPPTPATRSSPPLNNCTHAAPRASHALGSSIPFRAAPRSQRLNTAASFLLIRVQPRCCINGAAISSSYNHSILRISSAAPTVIRHFCQRSTAQTPGQCAAQLDLALQPPEFLSHRQTALLTRSLARFCAVGFSSTIHSASPVAPVFTFFIRFLPVIANPGSAKIATPAAVFPIISPPQAIRQVSQVRAERSLQHFHHRLCRPSAFTELTADNFRCSWEVPWFANKFR